MRKRLKEETLQAVKNLSERGCLATVNDIVKEIKMNRLLKALKELEKEGKVREEKDGWVALK